MHNKVFFFYHLLTNAQPDLRQHPFLPPSQLPPVLLFSTTPYYGMGYPSGWSGSALLSVCPHSFLLTSSLLAGRAVRGTGKSLTQCKHCYATLKTSVCYKHYFHLNPKYNTIPGTMKKINSMPVETRTLQYTIFQQNY